MKHAGYLLDFFRTDTTARLWYLAQPEPVVFGQGKQTSLGTFPSVGWVGTPSLASNAFSVTLTAGVPNKAVIPVFGPRPAQLPFFQGTLVRLPALEALAGADPQRRGSDLHAGGDQPLDAGSVPRVPVLGPRQEPPGRHVGLALQCNAGAVHALSAWVSIPRDLEPEVAHPCDRIGCMRPSRCGAHDRALGGVFRSFGVGEHGQAGRRRAPAGAPGGPALDRLRRLRS